MSRCRSAMSAKPSWTKEIYPDWYEDPVAEDMVRKKETVEKELKKIYAEREQRISQQKTRVILRRAHATNSNANPTPA